MIATKEYEAESDLLSQFILDECTLNPQAQVKASNLYNRYTEWCKDQGMKEREVLTNNAFGRRMGQKFKKSHKEGGAIYYGIGVKTDGLLTDFETNVKNLTLNSTMALSRGNKVENTSESVIPSGNNLLPNCPECGLCEWVAGKKNYICPCGHLMPMDSHPEPSEQL